MLNDSVEFVGLDAFPEIPIQSQVIYLAQDVAPFTKGLYVYDGTEWIGLEGASGTAAPALDLSALSQSIVPSADITYDLGSPTKMWRDIFVGPGSLYINGQKVLEENAGTIVVSADVDQNVQIKTGGTGDIEFLPSGTGAIEMKGNFSIQGGKNMISNDGLPISNTVGFTMNGEKITGLAVPIDATDAATKSYVDAHVPSGYAIKDAYESVPDTNVFDDGDAAKLVGIETGATADQTATEILARIKTVDGSGSGLDADKLDGNDAAYFAPQVSTYTKSEIDAIHDTILSGIDWKEAVNYFANLATTYPNAVEGWTASVNNEDTIYRYDGTEWVSLANGTVPLATALIDGKMSSSDFSKLQSIEVNATADQTASELVSALNSIEGELSLATSSVFKYGENEILHTGGNQTVGGPFSITGTYYGAVMVLKASGSQLRIQETDALDPDDFWLIEKNNDRFQLYYRDESEAAWYLSLRAAKGEVLEVNAGNDTYHDVLHEGGGQTIGGNLSVSGLFTIPDAGQLRLGTGADLLVYHNGSSGNIDNNTGALRIDSAATLELTGTSITANGNEIIHDGGGQTIAGTTTLQALRYGTTLTTDDIGSSGNSVMVNEPGLKKFAGASLTGQLPAGVGATLHYGLLSQIQDSVQDWQIWHGGHSGDTGVRFAIRRADNGSWNEWTNFIHDKGGQTINGTLNVTGAITANGNEIIHDGGGQTIDKTSALAFDASVTSTWATLRISNSDNTDENARGIVFGDHTETSGAGIAASRTVAGADGYRLHFMTEGTGSISPPEERMRLDESGATIFGGLSISNPTVPTSSTSVGAKGAIAYDSTYVYVCVATDTWRRAALSDW